MPRSSLGHVRFAMNNGVSLPSLTMLELLGILNGLRNALISHHKNIIMTIVGLECLRTRCEIASKSLGDMPAKCCREFDPRLVLQQLTTDEERERYKSLFHEFRTEAKERVYCPNTQCGAFISQYTIKRQRRERISNNDSKAKKHDSGLHLDDKVADCPQCNTALCLICKKNAHNGHPCQLEEDPIIAQIQKFGYKRCPRCGYGTRRMYGCSHMKCVCGAHWCWGCERNYAVCEAIGDCIDEDYDYSDDDNESENNDTTAEVEENSKAEEKSTETAVDGAVADIVEIDEVRPL